MPICHKCDGAGYLIYETQRDGKLFVQIFKCCDERKYSEEVKRRHAPDKPAEPSKVIQFPRRLNDQQ